MSTGRNALFLSVPITAARCGGPCRGQQTTVAGESRAGKAGTSAVRKRQAVTCDRTESAIDRAGRSRRRAAARRGNGSARTRFQRIGEHHDPGNLATRCWRRCCASFTSVIRDVIDSGHAAGLLELGDGQADIALRSTAQEPHAGTVGRRLCIDDWTLYCSREYAASHGVPRTREDLKQHAIIGGGGGKLWLHYEAWLRSLGLEKQVAMHHASSTGLLSAVRSGFGIAVLPCIVADADPDLVRCLPPRADHGREMWLLTHERVRHTPRVRLVIDFLYERLMRHVRMLEERRAAA